jgi:hypothetical protein
MPMPLALICCASEAEEQHRTAHACWRASRARRRCSHTLLQAAGRASRRRCVGARRTCAARAPTRHAGATLVSCLAFPLCWAQ